jgi:3-oxoacyl-[acyl-carrier protein] reductase
VAGVKQMAGSLTDQVAIVTGAGQGIGRAFALGLAGQGARVVAADLVGDNAETTAELVHQRGVDAIGLAVDVRDPAAIQGMVDATVARFGGLDILINNAGTYPRSVVLEMDEAIWDQVLDTNLKGTFLCSQAAARVMVRQGRGGRIVSLASRAAFSVQPRGAHYSASKAGIVAFSKGLALELAPHRITVNALAPGLTNTAQPRDGFSEEQLIAQAATIPLGRWAEPDDMVPLVMFLCAETGAYITGQTFHINGGALMV